MLQCLLPWGVFFGNKGLPLSWCVLESSGCQFYTLDCDTVLMFEWQRYVWHSAYVWVAEKCVRILLSQGLCSNYLDPYHGTACGRDLWCFLNIATAIISLAMSSKLVPQTEKRNRCHVLPAIHFIILLSLLQKSSCTQSLASPARRRKVSIHLNSL